MCSHPMLGSSPGLPAPHRGQHWAASMQGKEGKQGRKQREKMKGSQSILMILLVSRWEGASLLLVNRFLDTYTPQRKRNAYKE